MTPDPHPADPQDERTDGQQASLRINKCRIPAESLPRRFVEIGGVLTPDLVDARRREGTLRLRFRLTPERVAELARLVAEESACCPFLRFQLEVDPARQEIGLTLGAPADAAALLDAFERAATGGASAGASEPRASVDASPPTVLLTGATGLIGSAVARRLHETGHRVLALARSEQAEREIAGRGWTPVRGDLDDPEAIAALARSADGVIHAATTNDARNAALDTAVTRAILHALEGTEKPFVYTSGVWVLGATSDEPADERTATRPLAVVAHRGPLEREVLAGASRGVRSIVLRPGIAYGRGGGIPAMLAAEAREGRGVRLIADGRQEWPVVHVDDLADLYVRALDHAPPGAILHGVDAHVALRDVAHAASLGARADAPPRRWSKEEAVAEYGAFGESFALHQRVASAATREALGWTPSGPSLLQELAVGSYASPAAAPPAAPSAR